MQKVIPSLNEKVLRYQKTGQGLEEIIGTLSPDIYAFPKTKPGFQEDDCGEFFLYFYPRLVRSVKNFQDRGKPFEWYLNSILHWQFKSFCSLKFKRERAWRVFSRQIFWEPSVLESPAGVAFGSTEADRAVGVKQWSPWTPRVAEALGINASGRIEKSADRKRFLFWILKWVRLLDEQDVHPLAELTGFDRLWLGSVIEDLKQRLQGREKRIQLLRGRQNRAFYHSRLVEEELRSAHDPELRAALARRLERLKRTLCSAQNKAARVSLCPSNRELGEVLGIPKGSIDTSLYWLKKRLSMLYADHQDERQYA